MDGLSSDVQSVLLKTAELPRFGALSLATGSLLACVLRAVDRPSVRVRENTMMYKTGPLLPNTVQDWTLGPTIDEMLQSPSGGADKTSRTLVKGKDMTVVLTVLPKGQGLKEHQAPASLMVVVLRGEVVFDCEGVSSTLVAGERGVLAIGKNQPHAVQALSDSAFLLVMGTLEHSSHS